MHINYKLSYDDYTEDEIEIIINKFFEIQSKYPLGVCLRKDVHKLFHDTYGYGDNTPEQFYEFLSKYNNNGINILKKENPYSLTLQNP